MSSDKTFTISISTHTIFKVLVIGLVLAFLWYIKEVLLMLFLAILLAALIDPGVTWLQRHRIPRSLGVIGIYIVLLALMSLSFVLVIPTFVEQLQQLSVNFSGTFSQLASSLEQLNTASTKLGITDGFASGVQSLQDAIGALVGNVLSTITNVLGGVAALLVVLVLAFYIVVEEDAWRRIIRRVAPDDYQPYLSQLFVKIQNKIGLWLRGQLLLMLVIGVSVYLGLTILGVPYALVLGFFAGVMEMIPYAGPTLSAIPALAIALGISPLKGLMVLLLYVIIQQIENNILIPKIMQKTTGLNPVISIIALLIGYKIGSGGAGNMVGGILGVALAIPFATMLSVFVYDVINIEESGEKN